MAVSLNSSALCDASVALRDDPEIVLATVGDNADALKYANEVIQGDSGVLAAARGTLFIRTNCE